MLGSENLQTCIYLIIKKKKHNKGMPLHKALNVLTIVSTILTKKLETMRVHEILGRFRSKREGRKEFIPPKMVMVILSNHR